MLTAPLPTTLDIRKAAAREVAVSGLVDLSKLERIRDVLASSEGQLEVHCDFGRDEQNRSVVSISVAGDVSLNCQRCLEPMTVSIACCNELALVSDDEQAKQLPARLDPLIVDGELCDLWLLAEDELMLGLPIVSYHDRQDCKLELEDIPVPQESGSGENANPFNVLEQLKKPRQ